MRRRAPPNDQSHLLVPSNKEISYCPHCFLNVSLSFLRTHISSECRERVVMCKEPGCHVRVAKSELKRHLQRECLSVKKREILVLNSTTRPLPPTGIHEVLSYIPSKQSTGQDDVLERAHEIKELVIVVCEDCGVELVQGRQLNEHKESGCKMRKIFCPNRSFGCVDVIPISLCQEHLKNDCVYERRKELMINNSKLRRELIICNGCGSPTPLCELRKHEEDRCVNRYAPCRNASLGCEVRVRLEDRALHEHISDSSTCRSTLYMGPGGSHIFINEDDMSPPWTVEYWICRPSIFESLKNHLIGMHRRRMRFRLQFLAERQLHVQVVQIREQIASASELKDSLDANGVNVSLFRREALIEQLAQLVLFYENAAVLSEQLTRLLMLSVSAAMACLEKRVASDPSEVLPSIQPKSPGEILSEQLRREGRGDETVYDNAEEGIVMSLKGVIGPVDSRDKPIQDRDLKLDPMIDITVTDITVQEWLHRVLCVRENIQAERALLICWRNEAALLSQRASSSTGSRGVQGASGKVKTKKQMSEERKDLERRRREDRRRIERSEEESQDHGDNESSRHTVKDSRLDTKPKVGKKLHERLAEDAITLIGVEVLQSSSASPNKICIDVDIGTDNLSADLSNDGGRIGFVTAEGAFAFNSTIPRQKWTHIAIVCTSEPKRRTICYVNGAPCGKLSTSFALPMTALGSVDDDHSFVGCLLDIRVWAVPRSATEVRAGMHRLLEPEVSTLQRVSSAPASRTTYSNATASKIDTKTQAVSNTVNGAGLVAWWTFEDARSRTGWSARLTDISDQRFGIPIRSNVRADSKTLNFLWLDATSVVSKTLPLPSYRDQHLCVFEIKRFRLAQKGRALMREIECVNKCNQMIRAFDMRFHSKYECSLRRMTCQVAYCQEDFLACEQAEHNAYDCAIIKVRRRLIEQGLHLNEITLCSLCSESVRLRDLDSHNRDVCEHRTLVCKHSDCSASFPAHLSSTHLKFDCRSIHVLRPMILVRKARQRVNYSRPWGICVSAADLDDVDNDLKLREIPHTTDVKK